jgi:hypothetical protein
MVTDPFRDGPRLRTHQGLLIFGPGDEVGDVWGVLCWRSVCRDVKSRVVRHEPSSIVILGMSHPTGFAAAATEARAGSL